MNTRMIKARAVAVAGVVAVTALWGAPVASAAEATTIGTQNWSSSIGSAGRYFESRRWDDESYSQIWFTGCTIQNSTTRQTEVAVWEDNWGFSDTRHDTKTFTNCFRSSSAQSMGEWYGLPKDDYYFRLEDVGSNGNGLLWVRGVTVDTSYADR